MKNKILIGCSLIIAIISMNACTDRLDDIRNWDAMPTDVVFDNPELVKTYVNNFYDVLYDRVPRLHYYDESGVGSKGNIFSVLKGEIDAYGTGWVDGTSYNTHWTDIRQCNQFFKEIDKSNAPWLENEKEWLKGQVYFFRAYNYFFLVNQWGGVPIIADVQEAASDFDVLDVPRNTSLECFDFIEGQLDSAIMLLPDRGTTGYGPFRIDKMAAMAVKSKVMVTKAQPRFCNTKVDEYWQDAYDVVMATKAYALAQGFKLYDDGTPEAYYNLRFDHASRDIESLFFMGREWPAKTNNKQSNHWPSIIGRWVGKQYNPSWEFVQSYKMANGKDISDPTSGYDEDMFWEGRDPRFNLSIGYHGVKWPWPGLSENVREWTFRGHKFTGASQQGTGFNPRKLCDNTLDNDTKGFADEDEVYIRYAELLLWQAECANEIGKPAEALEQLKLIRERAGFAPDAGDVAGNYGFAAAVGDDYQATLDAIYDERKVELSWEGKLYWDYANRRNFQALRDMGTFHKYIPTFNRTVFNEMKFKDSNGNVINMGSDVDWTTVHNALNDSLGKISDYEASLIIKAVSDFSEYVYDKQGDLIEIPDYYEFAPYPDSEIEKSNVLEQTIGWVGGTFDPRITE